MDVLPACVSLHCASPAPGGQEGLEPLNGGWNAGSFCVVRDLNFFTAEPPPQLPGLRCGVGQFVPISLTLIRFPVLCSPLSDLLLVETLQPALASWVSSAMLLPQLFQHLSFLCFCSSPHWLSSPPQERIIATPPADVRRSQKKGLDGNVLTGQAEEGLSVLKLPCSSVLTCIHCKQENSLKSQTEVNFLLEL